MAESVIGMLQNYAVSKENFSVGDGVVDSSLHGVSDSCGGKLAGRTEGKSGMDGVAGRRTDNFIKWCHRCKHEVPYWLKTDKCDICGGDIVEIGE